MSLFERNYGTGVNPDFVPGDAAFVASNPGTLWFDPLGGSVAAAIQASGSPGPRAIVQSSGGVPGFNADILLTIPDVVIPDSATNVRVTIGAFVTGSIDLSPQLSYIVKTGIGDDFFGPFVPPPDGIARYVTSPVITTDGEGAALTGASFKASTWGLRASFSGFLGQDVTVARFALNVEWDPAVSDSIAGDALEVSASSSAVDRVLRKLNDERCDVWARATIEGFVQDGYDALVRATNCIFDMVGFRSEPLAANHTRKWEEQFFPSDWPILGIFNFTRESEREFAGPGAVGPSNNTRPIDAQYVAHPAARVLGQLPDGYTAIDRVTHDWLRLEPEHPRYLRESFARYETNQGGTYSYSVEQDGLFQIRTVMTHAPALPTIDISGTWGLLRQEDSTELSGDTVLGDWGILRAYPLHFPAGGPWGSPRGVIPDDRNTRVELFRLGRPLDGYDFEIPQGFIKYVEFWAMFRALGSEGEGEDKILSDHYKQRFDVGVARLKRRVQAVNDERVYHMGGSRSNRSDSYLSHFPSDFGRKRPFR